MHNPHRNLQTLLVVLLAALFVALSLLTMPAPVAARPPLGISMDDGSVSAPAYNFSSDTDTGIYRIGANNIGIATNGAKIFDCSATGCTIAGTAALQGVVTFSVNPIVSSESITPTDGGTLTPTKQVVTLTPAGAVGVDLGACTTGQATILYNSINANVVITDTGNGVLAGNQTLGQYDALPLVCVGAKWVQTGPASAN